MTATLETLRDRVEQMIADEANTTFSEPAIEEGIRQALHRYSKKQSLRQIATLTLPATGREVDISSLAGLLNVAEVWLPYTAASPEEPPLRRAFELWLDQRILYFPYPYGEPIAGEAARIFYSTLQTLDGLDEATETTIPPDDETLLAWGSAGYTVLPRAREATEVVMLDHQVPISKQLMDWAKMKLAQFEAGLADSAQRDRSVPWVRLGPLDRWDAAGRGWQ
jgi:hypothetical protein